MLSYIAIVVLMGIIVLGSLILISILFDGKKCPHGIRHGEDIGKDGKRICEKCQSVYVFKQELEKVQKDIYNQREREKQEGEKKKKYIKQYNSQREEASKQLEKASVSMTQILAMSPREFEGYIAHMLSNLGYTSIVQTPYSNDGGKDIICKKGNTKYYVECKQYFTDNSIGRPMIQKLAGAMMADDVKKGIFVTTSFYTNEAVAVAERLNIELIDGKKLADIATSLSSGLQTYELICPECGESVVFRYFDHSDRTCSRGHAIHGVYHVYHNTHNQLIYSGDLQTKQMEEINRNIPKKIMKEVNDLVNNKYNGNTHQMGLCHQMWRYTKVLLDERGYLWFSPHELNPDIYFD